MAELQDNMPPGWECKFDEKTGKPYYINHFTRTTTWEDPRRRHSRHYHGTPKHFSTVQVEHIPLQHGSPDLKRNYVYPSHPSPIQAFQMPSHMSPKTAPFQDMRSVIRMSPLAVRSSKLQENSLVQQTDTDEAVAKISALFPTVSETHIKLLLKKYHGREAVVISALQVEKHPITTPGPHVTPPPQRDIQAPAAPRSALRPRPGSPRAAADGCRGSPRPHSSPKLKLRYMKSVFPDADETIILDILQNNDNNIQKTSEALKGMGFTKKDTVKIAKEKMEAKIEGKKEAEEKKKAKKSPLPQPKMKSAEEKAEMKEKLQGQYKDVAEYLISIALESVNFDENRANQILQIMIQEDSEASSKKKSDAEVSETDATNSLTVPSVSSSGLPVSQSRQSIKSLLKEKSDKEVSSFRRLIDKSNISKPTNLLTTKGHNPDLAKGPNEGLLLVDYVDWQGPDQTIRKGPQGLAKGPNKNLLSNRTYSPRGPNPELRKGPKFGLAKGSIYSQLKAVIVGDSHRK